MKWGEGDFSVRGFFRAMRWWVPISLVVGFLVSMAADMPFGARLTLVVGMTVVLAPGAWLRSLDLGPGQMLSYLMVYVAVFLLIAFIGLLIFAVLDGTGAPV
jgi:hypothetical protein